jgi:starch synthase
MRYGTIPIVRSTGGLADTVREFDPGTGEGNGFVFSDYTAKALSAAVERALAVRSQPALWDRLTANAMAEDFSWRRSAERYVELYQRAAALRAGSTAG